MHENKYIKKRPNAQVGTQAAEIEVVVESCEDAFKELPWLSHRFESLLGELEAGRDTVGAGALLVEDTTGLGRANSSSL